MKEKIKAFVFGVPKTKWVWHSLMVVIVINMLVAIWINWAEPKITVWIMVALMWCCFYWLSETFSDQMLKRYRALTDSLLKSYKEAVDVIGKIKDEVDRRA